MTTTPETPTTPTAPTTPTDPRHLLRRAADQIDALLLTVRTADLDAPTPCREWLVRDLLSHLVAVETRIVHIAGGGHPFDVPSSVTGVPDDAWLGAWRERRGALDAVLESDDVLGRVVHHPAGDMPGGRALAIYANELAVHGWDLARALTVTDAGAAMATGARGVLLDQELAGAVLGPMLQALPAGGRDGMPFADAVPVPDDAPPSDRLVGWLGRDPAWTPSSDDVSRT